MKADLNLENKGPKFGPPYGVQVLAPLFCHWIPFGGEKLVYENPKMHQGRPKIVQVVASFIPFGPTSTKFRIPPKSTIRYAAKKRAAIQLCLVRVECKQEGL